MRSLFFLQGWSSREDKLPYEIQKPAGCPKIKPHVCLDHHKAPALPSMNHTAMALLQGYVLPEDWSFLEPDRSFNASAIHLSGSGKWRIVAGPGCDPQRDLESVHVHAVPGNILHLIDNDKPIFEHIVQSDDFMITAKPCHKKTIDINCAPDFVGEVPNIGMHVLCYVNGRVCVYRNGWGQCEVLQQIRNLRLGIWNGVAVSMNLSDRRLLPAGRFFDLHGYNIHDIIEINNPSHTAVLYFERGVFHWPPMNIGYKRIFYTGFNSKRYTNSSDDDKGVHTYTMETISILPDIFKLTNILPNSVRYALWENQKEQLFRAASYLFLKEPEKLGRFAPINVYNPHLIDIFQNITHIPYTRSEGFMWHRHLEGGGPVPINWSMKNHYVYSGRGRKLFFALGLNKKFEGGGIGFPYARVEKSSNSECGKFVGAQQKGEAFMAYLMTADGVIDEGAYNVVCPVESGQHDIFSVTYWNKAYYQTWDLKFVQKTSKYWDQHTFADKDNRFLEAKSPTPDETQRQEEEVDMEYQNQVNQDYYLGLHGQLGGISYYEVEKNAERFRNNFQQEFDQLKQEKINQLYANDLLKQEKIKQLHANKNPLVFVDERTGQCQSDDNKNVTASCAPG